MRDNLKYSVIRCNVQLPGKEQSDRELVLIDALTDKYWRTRHEIFFLKRDHMSHDEI